MQIDHFIHTSLPNIYLNDHAQDTLDCMNENYVSQLPVIDRQDKYQGIISQQMLHHVMNYSPSVMVSDVALLHTDYAVLHTQHPFEALKQAKSDVDFIPLIDTDQKLMGVVFLLDVIKDLNASYTIQKKGAVIELSIPERNYSLAHLSNLAETHHLKIIGLLVRYNEKKHLFTITIKLNKLEIKPYIAVLERFDYQVTGSYAGDEITTYDKKRFDLFLKYLEI